MSVHTSILERIVLTSIADTRASSTHRRTWSEEEDKFLRDHLATMTDEELGAQLGRSANAVHLRWERDLHMPNRSKDPTVLTGRRAAEMLGIDEHKISHWIDVGLIPGRLMPGKQIKFHTIHLVERVAYRRWVLNPMNWVYFDIHKVRDAELKRMLRKRADRWGDEWWTARQLADYHGVNIDAVKEQIYRGTIQSFHLPVSLGGRNHQRGWSNHFILKSVAVRAVFYHGKGSNRPCPFTPAADAWLLKARDELGFTFVHIGRMMKIGTEKVRRDGRSHANYMIGKRYHLLKANQKATRKNKSQ